MPDLDPDKTIQRPASLDFVVGSSRLGPGQYSCRARSANYGKLEKRPVAGSNYVNTIFTTALFSFTLGVKFISTIFGRFLQGCDDTNLT